MANCYDVAKYILEKKGELSCVKLQKLVYYSQAWSLVWDDTPLFKQKIEAWINGPVVPDLYNSHRGLYSISAKQLSEGNSSILSDIQKEAVDQILNYYGDKNSQWLSDLTHLEEPWKIARKGLQLNERGSSEITLDSMAEYYSSISARNDEE